MLDRRSVLVLALLGACGDDGGASIDAFVPADVSALDATPREVVMDPHTLVPGEFIEGIMTGGPGDVVGIKLSAPAPEIEWNIHGHADGGTQIVFEEFDKMTVEYVFQPTAQADWYLLVRNGGSTDMTIDLQVELYGAVTWRYQ